MSDGEKKRGAGRPLKFESPEALQEKIDEYFKNAKEGEYTVTGLALALDTTRHTINHYEAREEYGEAITKAKTRIENDYELSLRRKGGAGEIFGLKNFGWRDKTEVENTGELKVTKIERVIKHDNSTD